MFYLTFLILYLVFLFKNRLNGEYTFLIQLLPLFLIIIFRFGYGADYFAYELMYDQISTGSSTNVFSAYVDTEIGFKFIILLSKYLGLNFHQFIVVINSVTIMIFTYTMKKYSKNIELSLLLFYSMFFSVWILSALRQGLSMSISLYILFKLIEKNRKMITSNFIILSLLFLISVSIHKVSLFIILLYLSSKVKWNRSIHILLFSTTLIVSQLGLIKNVLSFIPIISNSKIFEYYISGNVNIFDFPGLIRILLFIFVVSFYDNHKTDFEKNCINIFLFGSSMYFLLKFSELTASRTYIYSFVILIYIVPFILSNLKTVNTKLSKVLVSCLIFIFSALFLIKEVNTMDRQSGLNQNQLIKKMPNIYQTNYNDFNSKYSKQMLEIENLKNEKEKYLSSVYRKTVDYTDSDNHYIISTFDDENKVIYRLINQDGNFVSYIQVRRKFDIMSGIVRTVQNEYIDLTGLDRNEFELKSAFAEGFREELDFDITKEEIFFDLNNLGFDFNSFFPFETEIEYMRIENIIEPFEYNILEVKYYNTSYYLYLDAEYNLLINLSFNNYSEYNQHKFLEKNTENGVVIFNEFGEPVWWY